MELNFLSQNTKVILSSLIVAVVLFMVISRGIASGQAAAQAEVITQITQNISAGLQYFYNDQDRFPSATEFADQNTMLNYFSSFPPVEILSANCTQNFVYKTVSDNNFQLNFCLPLAYNQYILGWNTINGQPAAVNP